MQKILDLEERSDEIVTSIKDDLSNLIELNNSNEKHARELKKTVDELHRQLERFENQKKENKTTPNHSAHEYIADVKIKRKIQIKNKKQSRSFTRWLFNNKEL